MSAIILDTETTGVDEPEVIQLGYLGPVRELSAAALDEGVQVARFRPTKPITLGAMATHHIIAADLEGHPQWPGRWDLPPGTRYIIGHNVDYDWKAIGSPNVFRICTLALARSLWPHLDSHSLPALTYHFTDHREARELLRNAHDAGRDVELCCRVLLQIVRALGVTTWHDLWLASEKARIPKVMPVGKHKGVPIEQVPTDYKLWFLRQPDVDPYLAKALRGERA